MVEKIIEQTEKVKLKEMMGDHVFLDESIDVSEPQILLYKQVLGGEGRQYETFEPANPANPTINECLDYVLERMDQQNEKCLQTVDKLDSGEIEPFGYFDSAEHVNYHFLASVKRDSQQSVITQHRSWDSALSVTGVPKEYAEKQDLLDLRAQALTWHATIMTDYGHTIYGLKPSRKMTNETLIEDLENDTWGDNPQLSALKAVECYVNLYNRAWDRDLKPQEFVDMLKGDIKDYSALVRESVENYKAIKAYVEGLKTE